MTRDPGMTRGPGQVVAIVLAAGRGERLGGRVKAALVLPDGQTFVAAIIAAARAGGVGPVIVVAAAPHEAATRAAALAAGADLVVVNPAPERGMASSFACGLDALPAGARAALAWPVDQPLVRAETVAAVVAAVTEDTIVVPTHDGRGGHPAAFGAGCFAACRAAADAPDGLRSVVRAEPARVTRLAVLDAGVATDVDTPADWAKIAGVDPHLRRST